ncbi:50S ribosomal protein L23 [Candidatus Woesebacteria bacterium]|nr:50S ribosomal protein L23 [Candidatus Woesebacteria bacterium]
MHTIHHISRRVVTEKATSQERNQVYMFEVNTKSSKTQIAEAFKMLYGEKPLVVRVVTRPPQSRKVGKMRRESLTPIRKIAYIQTKNPLGPISK